jgi:hypothetical protein
MPTTKITYSVHVIINCNSKMFMINWRRNETDKSGPCVNIQKPVLNVVGIEFTYDWTKVKWSTDRTWKWIYRVVKNRHQKYPIIRITAQGWTNPGSQHTLQNRFCTVPLIFCGFSILKLLHVPLLGPKNFDTAYRIVENLCAPWDNLHCIQRNTDLECGNVTLFDSFSLGRCWYRILP